MCLLYLLFRICYFQNVLVYSSITSLKKQFPYLVPVQRIEDDSICIEDMMRKYGVIDQSLVGHPDMATKISDLFRSSGITIDANLPSKKVCCNSVSV